MANQTTFKVGKLIRDKRYDNWVEKKRLISPPPSQTLVNSRKELINALHAKAAEEIEEAKRKCKDNNREEVLDELADVQQVVADLKTLQKEQDDDKTKAHENFIAQICSVFSIEIAEVITAQQRKEEKEGGFTGGHFVHFVTMPESDERHSYFKATYQTTPTAL